MIVCASQTGKNAARLVFCLLGLFILLYSTACVIPTAPTLEIQSGGEQAPSAEEGFCGPVPHLPHMHARRFRWGALVALVVFCCCPCCSLDTTLGDEPRDCILNRRKPRWMIERELELAEQSEMGTGAR